MFRIITAATAVCLAAALAGADEKFTYDRKITHVRIDSDTKKEIGRKENVEAKADGDPAKDAELIWHIRASTFETAPVIGDLFLDDKGQAWSILRRLKSPDGDRYVFACKKLAQPPVPPRE